MQRLLEKILNILFPLRCIICGTQGPDICAKCLSSFEPPKISNYDWIISLWNYRDPNVERLMRHIKNIPNQRIAKILAAEIMARLRQYKGPALSGISNAIVVPIPIGRARLRSRGYNQSLLLARPLAKLLRRTIFANILIKSKQTKKQGTTKSRSERLENIAGSFSVPNNQYRKINNRDIVIIDDITTTGSTLVEVRKVLLAHGAKNVLAITIAN